MNKENNAIPLMLYEYKTKKTQNIVIASKKDMHSY